MEIDKAKKIIFEYLKIEIKHLIEVLGEEEDIDELTHGHTVEDLKGAFETCIRHKVFDDSLYFRETSSQEPNKKLRDMEDKELLDEYNEFRNKVDGIIESGGIGKWELYRMDDLLNEIYRRKNLNIDLEKNI